MLKNKNESFLIWAELIAFASLSVSSIFLVFWTHTAHANPFIFIGILIITFCICFGSIIVLYCVGTMRDENRLLNIGDWKSINPHFYPHESELDLGVPREKAFHLSQLALQLLPSARIIDTDPDTGTIVASSETLMAGISVVILTLEKNGGNATRVRIRSAYSRLHDLGGRNLVDNTQNKQIIKTISDYLREPSRQRTPGDLRNPGFYPVSPDRGQCSTVSRDAVPATDPFYKNPHTAAILSLLFPGLGQAYNGRSDEAMVIALGTGICLMLYLIPGALIWMYGVYSAYTTARKMNDQEIPFRHTTVPGMVLAAGFAIVCPAAAIHVIGIFGLPGLVTFGMDPIGTCLRIRCI